MKKENLYILAGTLAITSVIGFSTFASSTNSSTSIVNIDPKTAIVDKEINDKQELSSNDEGKTETKDDNVVLPANHITEESAKKIALASNPGTLVTGFSTEDENGTIVFNVALNNKSEVKVDVVKGTILKTDKTDKTEGGKESANDSDSKNED